MIPAPLVVAQAAIESAWGNSPLAKDENNILGLQVKFNNPSSMKNYKNCRPAKKAHDRCLLKFDDYSGSVYEYFARFNGIHYKGYQDYRKNRLSSYKKGGNSCDTAILMANHIDFYAENPNYIKEIKSMVQKICPLIKNCNNFKMATLSQK